MNDEIMNYDPYTLRRSDVTCQSLQEMHVRSYLSTLNHKA